MIQSSVTEGQQSLRSLVSTFRLAESAVIMECFTKLALFSSLFASFTTRGAHIVGIPSLGISHGRILAKVGRELSRRGHSFTLLVPTFQTERILFNEIAVKTFETPITSAHLESAMLGQIEGHLDINETASLWKITCESMLNSADLLSSLGRVDLIFCDIANLCAPIVADLLKAPRVDISPAGFLDPFLSFMHNFPTPVAHVPQLSSNLGRRLSFLRRVQNTFLYFVGYGVYKFLILPPYEELWRSHVNESKFSSIEELFRSSGLLLIPTDFAFDVPRPVGAHVQIIGPVLPEPPKPLPDDLLDFITKGQPKDVILVSFGSVISNFSAEFTAMLVSAWAKTSAKVIWKSSGPRLESTGENTNVRVVPWMPQNDLLGHPAINLFVTHGGLNSLLEAAYHGVPTVVIPLYGDQLANAAKVREKNTGLVLNLKGLNVEHIVSAVNEVLKNSSYKGNAFKLAKLMQHQGRRPTEKAADWVEYGLNNDVGLHFRSEADNLYFYELYLMDVILFIGIVLALVVFTLYILFRLMLQCVVWVWKVCIKVKSKED